MLRDHGLNEPSVKPYLTLFLIAFATGLSILLPYIILDKGIFLFFGDYCVQQVPFYSLAHDAIRSGNVLWNWNTDLGANFVGSYAFYLLGSPFFWLTVPLPSAAVPYTLGPLLALKMAVAALTSYAYIRRFVRRSEIAAIGAMLYAFSSWSIYDIFFNHFHEPMAFFPLLLIALEEYMMHDRRGVFALTVALNALVNYLFFVSEVVFLLIYFVLRLSSGEWRVRGRALARKFLFLAFESLVGVGISAVLLLPALLAITGNYRTTNLLSGWNLLLYGWNQRYPDILHSLFFPQDIPSRPNFFPDSNANWSSVAAWLPMFSMCGVISFFISRRGHWLRRIMGVCFVMAFIPALNAAYVLLNDNYYGRWFFMPVLMMATATAIALEDPKIDWGPGLRWTLFVTLGIALGVGLIPKRDNGKIVQIGLEEYPVRFWATVALVLLGLLLLARLLRKFDRGSRPFANVTLIVLAAVICIYGNFFVSTGKEYGWPGAWFESTAINGASKIRLSETRFYRVDVYDGIDNQAMFWRLPTINAFQSVVPASVMNFYNTVGVQRDVASRPSVVFAGLRPLLSVKYLFDQDKLSSLSMPGWRSIGTQLGFKVWENENYIPMGFTYRYYMTKNLFNSSGSKDRILLKALLLSPAQIAKYGDILSPLPLTAAQDVSDAALAEDSAARREETCSAFKTDNAGFSASITLKKQNLVFFSVPYDSGWSATVNGKAAKIEQVNIGFMAVLCPAGTSSIRFNYHTPGLAAGAAVAGCSLAVFGGYMTFFLLRRRKKTAEQAAALAAKGDKNA